MVFQHFMLADNLTVWENIVLGDEPGHRAPASTSARPASAIVELGRNYGLDVDPDELVADLGVGEKQRAEILKVLYRNARIIILDEPTAVLVPQEVDELFDSLRGLVARGVTIIFISHKLDEVLKVADAITVDPRRAHRGRGAARRRDGARAGRADGGQRAAEARTPASRP